MLSALSYLVNFLKGKIKSKVFDVIVNNKKMICEISYNHKTKVLCISYRNIHNALCRQVKLPSSTRKFAKDIIKDFTNELATEIYKIELLC